MSENKIVIEQKTKASWEEYVTFGMEAREQKDNSQWSLGDLALGIMTDYGDDTIGKYGYAIGVEKKTLMNYRTISERFDKGIREKYPKLSFSHFACLTAVVKPEAWLEKADNEEWSVEHLRHEIQEAYPQFDEADLRDEPPDVYKCPECNHWRLKDMSSFDICRGHYSIKKGEMVYE